MRICHERLLAIISIMIAITGMLSLSENLSRDNPENKKETRDVTEKLRQKQLELDLNEIDMGILEVSSKITNIVGIFREDVDAVQVENSKTMKRSDMLEEKQIIIQSSIPEIKSRHESLSNSFDISDHADDFVPDYSVMIVSAVAVIGGVIMSGIFVVKKRDDKIKYS